MRNLTNILVVAAALWALLAPRAHAGEHEVRVASTELGAVTAEGLLDAGGAGYDSGFVIRGRDFRLRANLTLQARFEAYGYSDRIGSAPNGDLSGFALPRATLKLSGTAPCRTRWYTELELGHFGRDTIEQRLAVAPMPTVSSTPQTLNYDVLREAWLEMPFADALNVRFGLLQPPGPRETMVPVELTQFTGPSIAAVFLGQNLPGHTDRNRDYGVMLHGAFGRKKAFSYALSGAGGDGGDHFRTALDHRTLEDPEFAGRLNWAIWNAIGYEEGALRQCVGRLYAELGVWGRVRSPGVVSQDDRTRSYLYGFDVALGYGGWSLTGWTAWGALGKTLDSSILAANVQLGYHWRGTPLEIAVRVSGYDVDSDPLAGFQRYRAERAASGILNYYLDGHGNKLQLEATFLVADDELEEGPTLWDPYGGFPGGFGNNDDPSMLLRFQWQLAL